MRPSVELTSSGLSFGIVSGVLVAFGAVGLFKGLAAGPVSLVSPISAAYPLVTTIVALLVFNAQLSLRQLFGIALVMTGILLAAELIGLGRVNRKIGVGPAWAFLSVLSWGVGFALLAQAISSLGWQAATFLELASLTITFVILLPFIKGREKISLSLLRRMSLNKFILSAALIQLIGVFAINLGMAYETTSGAVIVAISACYPVLTIFLALRHFKEEVKYIPLLGAFISIAGVVILSL